MIYSIDLRKRVIAFIETGRLEAPPLPPRSWRKLNPEALVAYVEAHPDRMLEDYAEHFQTGVSAT